MKPQGSLRSRGGRKEGETIGLREYSMLNDSANLAPTQRSSRLKPSQVCALPASDSESPTPGFISTFYKQLPADGKIRQQITSEFSMVKRASTNRTKTVFRNTPHQSNDRA